MTQPHFLQTLQRSNASPLLTIDDITWDYKKKRSIMFPSVIDMSDKLNNITPVAEKKALDWLSARDCLWYQFITRGIYAQQTKHPLDLHRPAAL